MAGRKRERGSIDESDRGRLAGDENMTLRTRLTERLGIRHPILLAPMGFAAGGKLAGAVSEAGGLGLIGGGYGDGPWIEREFAAAGNRRVGIGFITWSLARNPGLLDAALARHPAAVMLSFGDPAPFAPAIKAAWALLICQVQNAAQARAALDCGADILVAQGTEAGGHGGARATLPLVPAIVDLAAARAADAIVVAAGGIADGRGLAAALMLGAAGALIGTRFYASVESLAHEKAKARLAAASGEDTLRTATVDIVRRLDWPREFSARVLRNDFVERWHGQEAALTAAIDRESERYRQAAERGDFATAAVFGGEAADLVTDAPPAAEIVARLIQEAEAALREGAALLAL